MLSVKKFFLVYKFFPNIQSKLLLTQPEAIMLLVLHLFISPDNAAA